MIKIRNKSLEIVTITSIRTLGLSRASTLNLTTTMRCLRKITSGSFVVTKKKEYDDIQLVLPPESVTSLWIEFHQNFDVIMAGRKKAAKKLRRLRKEHSKLVKMKESSRNQGSPEESLRMQAERIERRYELEKEIRRLERKDSRKSFSRKRTPVLEMRISDGRAINIELRHRNLMGHIRIWPDNEVFEMKFPGPTKIIKFKIENGYGRDIRINKVSANPIKYGMFDVNLLTAQIKASTSNQPVPVDFLRAFVKIPKISIAGSSAYQPYSSGHPDHFTVNDLEMFHDDQRVWEILKREGMLEFEVGFSVHTNIVPVISFKAKIRLVQTELLEDGQVVNLGEQSVEVQSSHHLTLSNPFNQVDLQANGDQVISCSKAVSSNERRVGHT